MYGYIYMTTNLVNNKIYIGQHKSTKFCSNGYLGSGTLFCRALERYGRPNFVKTLLCECDSREELNKQEIYYIGLYNSTDRGVGYNILIGGSGFSSDDPTFNEVKIKNHNRLIGTTIMTKGGKEVAVKSHLIQTYLDDGYVVGRSESAKESLSRNYNYSVKGMLGKKQSDKQRKAASVACSYKRSAEQRKNFSDAKKVSGKYICMRTPDNKSTIRCLIKNKDKYLAQGYLLCRN